MTPRTVSDVRLRADELSGDATVVIGPLEGYHHETYVFPLPDGTRVVKCREPRAHILWFDRRCFVSEEELLCALAGRIARVPEIVDMEGVGLQRFIEGRTLGASRRLSRRVPEAIFGQIVGLFGEMVRITPAELGSVERRCAPEDRAEDGDSDGFLERLVVFIEEHVYARNAAEFGPLFHALGVGEEAFTRLRKHVAGLKERPFSLLHADLHRENFIVDPQGLLWTIDWELAMLGDPLYDLATHLHLMRYPADQELRMTHEWCRAVEGVRPGSSHGREQDLARILGFKRAQSVFTDVIRVSLSLSERGEPGWFALHGAAGRLQRVLIAAAEPLGLEAVPSRSEITAALARVVGGGA
ncbi:aminoglycoside phosphotransferase family protein [Streptomyces sp. NPDC050625]|uniref:aminoglycoside phosphotransferase family protein n=1 Tax=Streptomyces sp. NPDC050625 TaxID=3154629 RepID=UPI00343C9CCD